VEFARVWKCLDNFRFGGEVLGSVLVKVRDWWMVNYGFGVTGWFVDVRLVNW
jgi:hypothetical protein